MHLCPRACGKALELCAWKAGHIPGALESRRVNSGPAARQHHKEWRAAAVALTGTVLAGLADPVRPEWPAGLELSLRPRRR